MNGRSAGHERRGPGDASFILPFPADVLTVSNASTRPPVNLKIEERRGNVIENKQLLRKTIGRSGNVIENTHT